MSSPPRSLGVSRADSGSEAWRWHPSGSASEADSSRSWPILTLPALVALVVTVATSAAVFFGHSVSYSATAESFVSPATKAADESDPYASSTFVLQRMESYPSLATSTPVLAAAIEQVATDMTPEQLVDKVTAQNPPRSVLLTVTVTDADPQRAADLANAVSMQQAQAIEDLEGAGGRTSETPVRVSVVTEAAAPAKASISDLSLTSIASGVATGAAAFVVVLVLRYRRRGRASTSSMSITDHSPGGSS